MALQDYTPADLNSRTAVAMCGIGCLAANMAKKSRYGSITFCEQKQLEMVVAQFQCIRTWNVVALPGEAVIKVTTDGGTDTDTTILVNGVTISNPYLYTVDDETTAKEIADAINSFTSTPDYTAIATGDSVTITSVIKGSLTNGHQVTTVGGDVIIKAEAFNGGQNGVEAEDNHLTQEQVEHMFNNIAQATGCCYAPLGYGYETPKDPAQAKPSFTWNSGLDIELNTTLSLKQN